MKRLQLSFLFVLVAFGSLYAQVKEDTRLYWPEKLWALSHPFVATKAKKLTNEVVKIVNDQFPNGDFMGGKADAFKHTLWMACLAIEIGERRSLKLGEAHERSNYIQFKRGIKKGVYRVGLPDSLSKVMDLHNNKVGCRMAKAYLLENERLKEDQLLVKSVSGFLQTAIKDAEVVVLSKDTEGRRLQCNGQLVQEDMLRKRVWALPGCLVPLNN